MTYSHFWFRHPALDIKAVSTLVIEFEKLAGLSDALEPWRPRLATCGDWLAIGHTVGPTTIEAGRILEAISAVTKSDALYFHGESVCETVTYCHWRAGRLQRNLQSTYLGNDTWPLYWQVVEGEPEQWEREVFFTEKRLRAVLCEAHDANPEVKLAFEPYWQAGRIAKGQSEPFHGGARELFWEIVRRNELPTCYHAH